MDIYFKDIRYGDTLNISFGLEDGKFNLDHEKLRYAVGDCVELMVNVTDEQAQQIKESCVDRRVEIATGKMHSNDSLYMFIKFTIIKKRHVLCLSRKEPRGHLEPHSPSLYLQAISWGYEDIFKWLLMGIKPTWVEGE
jgi:hypothetical protein